MATHWHLRRQFPELKRRGIAVEIVNNYSNPDHSTHVHDVCFLSLLRRGSARHRVGADDWVESAGTMTVVHPGIEHGFAQTRRGLLDVTNVYLDQDVALWERLPAEAAMIIGRFLRPVSDPGIAVASLPLINPLRTGQWLTLIDSEQRNQASPIGDAAIAHLAALFLIDIARAINEGVRRPAHWNDAAVGRAVAFLESHFSDPLPLALLASSAGISPWELCRRCRACTGVSVGELIRNRRIEEALRLLRDPQRPIIDIAFSIGFGSVTAFNRTFKEVAGTSPRAYRSTLHGTSPS